MKILPLDQFKVECLGSRKVVCTLPTEFVWPSEYTGEFYTLNPNRAYCYCISPEIVPFEWEERDNIKWNHHFYALEVWGNWGDDGHVEHKFENMFIIVRDDEMPKTYAEYKALVEAFYDERRAERERQYQEHQKKVEKGN